MAEFLPPAVQKFIADTRQYNDPINESARRTEQFGRKSEEAALIAQKAMNSARDAVDRLGLAERDAAEAVEKLRRGEIDQAAATELATRAVKAKERADITSREAALAAARADQEQAANLRQVARDAALAQAAEQIRSIESTKAAKKNKDDIQALAKAFPELKTEAENAFKTFADGVEKASTDVGMMQKVGLPALAGVLANLPTVAGAAGGAIALVMGGAFSAIALKADMSSKSAQASIKEMTKFAKQEAKGLVQPFDSTWHNIDLAAQKALTDLRPTLIPMFRDLAAGTNVFVNAVGNNLNKLSPMFQSLGRAYESVMQSLGDRMPAILNNVGTGFKAIFDAVQAHPDALPNMIEDLTILIRITGDLIGWLIRGKDAVKGFFDVMAPGTNLLIDVGKALGFNKSSTEAWSASNIAGAKSSQEVYKVQGPLVTALDAEKATVDQLKQAFDRFTGANQSAATASINMYQATADMTKALKVNGATMDQSTQKGRDNYKQLIAVAQAYQDDIVAMRNDGAGQGQLQAQMDLLNARFYKFALQLTGNAQLARTLTDRLLGIAKASDAIPRTIRQDIYQYMHYSVASRAAVHDINTPVGATGGYYTGRKFLYGDGGMVDGPGTGTSDSVYAPWLSKGEFVVNARATRENLGVLKAINAGIGKIARPPKVKKPSTIIHGLGHGWSQVTPLPPFHPLSPEYQASQRAVARLSAERYSAQSAWMLSGGAGSGPGVTVQHITNVYVQGSVLTENELYQSLQARNLQTNLRNPTNGLSLPSGRVG